MSTAAPAATKRQQHDTARREPDYTELVESIGARRAAQSMRTYFEYQAALPQLNGPTART